MNFTKKILLTFSLLLALAVSASAQKPFVVNLWQNGAPNDNGDVADTATVKVFLPRKEGLRAEQWSSVPAAATSILP